jgi:hypothetical protein
MPKTTLWLSGVALAALLLACAGSSKLLGGPWVEPEVVQFSYLEVTPETVQIPPGGNVTWVNNADETRGFVVFPASIASAFQCTDLRPYFERAGDLYRSLELMDEESERVQLPCALAPGTYPYEIWLFGAGFGKGFDLAGPEKRLTGKIVVQ